MKLIFNGYYRSGSTMMFRIMQRSNPEKNVFWEPLQHGLYYNLLKFQNGLNIGNEEYREFMPAYAKLSEKGKTSLIKKHSSLVTGYFLKRQSFLEYLKEFEKEDPECILQTNRSHFFLNEVSKKYGCKWIHIIRNPLDEWKSFIQKDKSKSSRNSAKKGVKDFLGFLLKRDVLKHFPYILKTFFDFYSSKPKDRGPFNVNREYENIKEIFNLDDKAKDEYDKFLVCWSKINGFSIKQAKDSKNGKVVWYENILQNPKDKLKELSEFSEIKFSNNVLKIRKSKLDFSEKDVKDFWGRCERLGIKEDFKEILKSSKNKSLLKEYEI